MIYAEALVRCLAFQKWQLLCIHQVFINHLLWTKHQVLKIKQSKAPVLLLTHIQKTLKDLLSEVTRLPPRHSE